MSLRESFRLPVLFQDFFHLFFPRVCAACEQALAANETVICSFCHYYLPRTGFHLLRDNELEKHFWGRVPLQRATAWCYFQKGSRMQQLIHKLKYHGRTDIGRHLGLLMGQELLESPDFAGVDLLLPIPLHRSRQLQRGYNQAESICAGLSAAIQRPWLSGVLVRQQATDTQTRKNRFERWENVSSVFAVADAGAVSGRHVLLVDDVITTGATLEAAAVVLLQQGASAVSIAGLGWASR